MSISAVDWAFRQTVGGSAMKFLLVAMANYADENGICYPSVRRLTDDTEQDRKTILKHIAKLESLHLLQDTNQRCGKTKSVPIYRLLLSSSPKNGMAGDEQQKQSQKRDGQAVPNFLRSGPVFPPKQSQKRDTDPSGTVIGSYKHERERGSASIVEERPSLQEVLTNAAFIGLAEWKATDWFYEMEGCGWLDYNHRPIVNWRAVLLRVKVKWEADGRPSTPPVAKSSQAVGGHKRTLTPLDIKTIIQAKEVEAVALKQRYSSEVAIGSSWSDDTAKAKYFETRREIKKLNHQLSSMA